MSTLIERLIILPESKVLEFKQDLSSPKNVLKTLVAFANSAGGQIIIGVDDNKGVLGVEDPLAEEERICNLIGDSISPRLVPNIELMSHDNKTLLVIEVFPSSNRPHYLNQLGPEHGVYVRLGSSNRQAGPDLTAELKRSTCGEVFDEQPMLDLSIEDLDQAKMHDLFGPIKELNEKNLLTLKLLRKEQGRLVPTRGAILLFGNNKERYFPDAWVQCGRFRGTTKVDIFDQAEIYSSLPESVYAIEAFLQKHAFKSAQFGAMQRKDVWSIPLTILREALVNALVHSDYSQRGTPIRIAFFDDRIDIESPGMLLPGMTIEDMKSGVSKIRNPVIARVFRELRLIEQWGSGIKRIFTEAEVLGLPEPEISEIATGLRLRIFFTQIHQARDETEISTTQLELEDSGLESRLESRLESALAARVILLLKEQTMGKAELAQRLGHVSVSGALNRQIKHLLVQDLVELTIPDKPTSRLQQYRLTAQGVELLKGNN
ncbi:MAG: helix-turn-helix domain-containing protein [Pseudomonas sp.]|nr:helix-turn-helix domain-containing protein [Pseudomonas sp.]